MSWPLVRIRTTRYTCSKMLYVPCFSTLLHHYVLDARFNDRFCYKHHTLLCIRYPGRSSTVFMLWAHLFSSLTITHTAQSTIPIPPRNSSVGLATSMLPYPILTLPTQPLYPNTALGSLNSFKLTRLMVFVLTQPSTSMQVSVSNQLESRSP